MRQSRSWARRQRDSKPDVIREGLGVDAAGMWDEGHASYPGRSAGLPCATGTERRRDGWQKSAEAIVAGKTGRRRAEHGVSDEQADGSMTRECAEGRAEMPGASPRVAAGSRESRERVRQAPRQRPSLAWPEATDRLMEEILDRENMRAAYRRVVANKGRRASTG